ncbi:HARBI1 family protein [Modestobacter lapidis]|nr:transposase family protein [Modestobacter lapidis]
MSHRASLDVSAPVLRAVTGWVARRRRRPGSRPAQRAGTVHTQVVLVLRWLRHRLDLRLLARDAGISIATAYRYLHEGLDAIAAHTPDLHDVLDRAHAAGLAFLCLDGTLVPTDRIAARAEAGHNLWYSGKHRAFGGNVQVLTDPSGFPLWVSAVRPGSTHDMRAARELVLPALYPHAARGLPVLTDKGYAGAGVGIHAPIKRQPDGQLHTDNRCYNELITALRAPTERGHALLGRWRALDRVTVCPQRITAIAAAALVLTSLDRGTR